MKLEDMSDKDLIKIAVDIKEENKRRANRKAAAIAIIAVLKKHRLSIGDLPELELGKRPSKTGRKRSVTTRAKTGEAKKTDKRVKVAYKYKNPKSSDKWSGRGRAPGWVSEILTQHKITIAQFETDKRFKA